MERYAMWLERYNWYKQYCPHYSDWECREMAEQDMEYEQF